jgi:phosphatidylglycerophosphate synthase
LRTPLSANHVSVLGLVVGLISVYLFSLGQWFHLILGASLLHLFLILDCTDGEVARYRKTAGMSGRYVEGMVHPILRSAIFIGLGLGIFKKLNDFSVVLLIFLTCYSDSLSSVAYSRKMSLLPQNYKIRNAIPLGKKLVTKPIGILFCHRFDREIERNGL